jgi:poly-beta-hydroxyalkanoate depolymerase
MVTMTRYETIVNLGDNFIKLMGKSLIPVHVLDWKVYYEAYLKQAEAVTRQYGKPKKTLAAALTAETYSISERSMFNVIAFMEG